MATCLVCPDRPDVADVELLEHLRLLHPDAWGEPATWPDGRIVVLDTTLTPGDLTGPRSEICVNCDVEGCDGCWGAGS